jgi:hypothetical protein
MDTAVGTVFDPETIELMKTALDEAWTSLNAAEQAKTDRSSLAERILKAAARGERDPARLRAHALIAMAHSLSDERAAS